MRNEIIIGDYKRVYFKIIDSNQAVEDVYLVEADALAASRKHGGKVMKVTKSVKRTVKYERLI